MGNARGGRNGATLNSGRNGPLLKTATLPLKSSRESCPNSIVGAVGAGLELAPDDKGLLTADVAGRDAAFGDGFGEVFVDGDIVEASEGLGIGNGRRINDAVDPCPPGGGGTHRAALGAGVEGASGEHVRAEVLCGVPDGFHLAVAGRVFPEKDTVESLPDDASVLHNHRTERAPGFFDKSPVAPQFDRPAHEADILRIGFHRLLIIETAAGVNPGLAPCKGMDLPQRFPHFGGPMIPTEHTDPVNARILAVSEDQISGFSRSPFRDIAAKADLPLETVLERIRAMVEAGTIRRVRQTLLATNLAEGALVAWKVPAEKLDAAFEFMFREDPFSGHVVVRSTDAKIPGEAFKLWTTLKVPAGQSLDEHCRLLMKLTGAEAYRLMPARGIFALGVGHVRRKTIEPGDRCEGPARMLPVGTVHLTDAEWQVLMALKREFEPEEIREPAWDARAAAAGVTVEEFFAVAESLQARRLLGRFSTFLEHVKPSQAGVRVTRFNALFHWAVPGGREVEAGSEVGRHEILTHCYWREAGPEFNNVNIMAVAHGSDKDRVLAHKAAIDAHLAETGIPVLYTNVFWGGRSEIKPSEISPFVYREWHRTHGA